MRLAQIHSHHNYDNERFAVSLQAGFGISESHGAGSPEPGPFRGF
jgi:hypothetical protein